LKTSDAAILVATTFLGLTVVLPWTETETKKYALIALAGLVAGHLNGRNSAKNGAAP
jgi:hydrogenase/urease accessory protein HupE